MSSSSLASRRRAPCSLSGCRPRGRGPDHRRTSGEWEPRVPCHACHEILVIKPWRPRYRRRYSYAPLCRTRWARPPGSFRGSPFSSVDKAATLVSLEPPSRRRRPRDGLMEMPRGGQRKDHGRQNRERESPVRVGVGMADRERAENDRGRSVHGGIAGGLEDDSINAILGDVDPCGAAAMIRDRNEAAVLELRCAEPGMVFRDRPVLDVIQVRSAVNTSPWFAGNEGETLSP